MLEFDTQNINLGLDRVAAVLSDLGGPHLKYPALHVAGTNGKGSVCAMSAQILKDAGYRAGLFTSPHLFKWNERIKVNGDDISDENLKCQMANVKLIEEKLEIKLTPFEVITCAAFNYFAEKGVDIAVVEVGMGGRLDATNVVGPLVTVITNVSLDHVEYLGRTIREITFEKAGIIKPNVPVVTGDDKEEVLSIIREVALKNHSQVRMVLRSSYKAPGIFLKGHFQKMNAAVVIEALNILKRKGFIIKPENFKRGFANTVWPGRFEIVSENPMVIIDGAHNEAGALSLRESVKNLGLKDPLTLVLGFQEYKDPDRIMDILMPLSDNSIITMSGHPQALDPEKINRIGPFRKVRNARDAFREAASSNNPVLIAGSLFLAAEALDHFGKKPA